MAASGAGMAAAAATAAAAAGSVLRQNVCRHSVVGRWGRPSRAISVRQWASARRMATAAQAAMTVVDMHSHFLPRTWPDFAQRWPDGGAPWPWLNVEEDRDGKGKAETGMLMLGSQPFRPVGHACWDPEVRLRDMDADGVDHQLLSATPILFQYDRPVEQTLSVAQYFNDAVLEEYCAKGNGRLWALAQVPLQDIDASCEEASRAKRAGHLGVQIGNHVGPLDLDNEGLVTFLQHCAQEGIPVLVHPWDMLEKERLSKYMMGWTVGMPAETQLSIVAMILGGAFDRVDRRLKIVFAHGGGSFVFLLGRLQNAWMQRDLARGVSEHPPTHYLDRFYLDSAVFDERALKMLVDVMGEDRVLLGSDYPFPLGEQGVGKLIRDTGLLDETVKRKLLGENAKKVFGMPI